MSRCWLWIGLLALLVQHGQAQQNVTDIVTTSEQPSFFRRIFNKFSGFARGNDPDESTIQPLAAETPSQSNGSTKADSLQNSTSNESKVGNEQRDVKFILSEQVQNSSKLTSANSLLKIQDSAEIKTGTLKSNASFLSEKVLVLNDSSLNSSETNNELGRFGKFLEVELNSSSEHNISLSNVSSVAQRDAKCLAQQLVNGSSTKVASANDLANEFYHVFAEIRNGSDNGTGLPFATVELLNASLVNNSAINGKLLQAADVNSTSENISPKSAQLNANFIGANESFSNVIDVERDAKCFPLEVLNNSVKPENGNDSLLNHVKPENGNDSLLNQFFKVFSDIKNGTENATLGDEKKALLNVSSATDNVLLRVGKQIENLTSNPNNSIRAFYYLNCFVYNPNKTANTELNKTKSALDHTPRALFHRFFGIGKNQTISGNETERLARYYAHEMAGNHTKSDRLNRYLTFIRKNNWTYNGYARHLNLSDDHEIYRQLRNNLINDLDDFDDVDNSDYFDYLEFVQDKNLLDLNNTSLSSKTHPWSKQPRNSTVKFPSDVTSIIKPQGEADTSKNSSEQSALLLNASNGNNTDGELRELTDKNSNNVNLFDVEPSERDARLLNVSVPDNVVREVGKVTEANGSVEIIDLDDELDRDVGRLNVSGLNETENLSSVNGSALQDAKNASDIGNETDIITIALEENKTRHDIFNQSQEASRSESKTIVVNGSNVDSQIQTKVEKFHNGSLFNASGNDNETENLNIVFLDLNDTNVELLPQEGNFSQMLLTIMLDDNATATNESTSNPHRNITEDDLNLIFKFLKGNSTENSTDNRYNTPVVSQYEPVRPKDKFPSDLGFPLLEETPVPIPPRVDNPHWFQQPPFIWHAPSQGYRIYLPPPLVERFRPHFPDRQMPMKLVCPPTATQRCPFYIAQGMRKCYVPMDCPRPGQLCCRVGCGVECIDGILVPIPTHFY